MKKIWSKKNAVSAILFLVICSCSIYIKANTIHAEAVEEPVEEIVTETVDGMQWTGQVGANGEFAIEPAVADEVVGSVTIPDELKGHKVTSIAVEAFSHCESLQEIFIPSSVTEIKKEAFYWCTSLQKVTMSDNVIRIEQSAFQRCLELKTITLPNSLKEIGSGAFLACFSLEKVTIPDSVTTLGAAAFGRSINLKEVVLPNGITKLGEGTFMGCTSLIKVNMPDTLTTIEESVFEECESLEEINIPSGVTEIPWYAFQSCYSLKKVTMSDNVTQIGFLAFNYCEKLEEITLSASLTTMLEDPFTNCTSLKNINVPDENGTYSSVDGVLYSKDKQTLLRCPAGREESCLVVADTITIQRKAFEDCGKLKEIIVQSDKVELGTQVFCDCASVEKISFTSGLSNISRYAFYDCYSLKEIELPASLTKIEAGTFKYCQSLERITIPSNVTEIGEDAFGCCVGLKEITIPSGVSSIAKTAFGSCINLQNINVSPDNPNYSSVDGVLFNSDKSTIISFPSGRTGDYEIPSSVTSLDCNAFWGTELLGLNIPVTVKKIVNCTACEVKHGGSQPHYVILINHEFYYPKMIPNIYYDGTYTDYQKIEFDNTESNLGSGRKIYCMAISIVDQPKDAVCTDNIHNLVPLSVSSTSGTDINGKNAGTLSYQWYENSKCGNTNGKKIEGATESTYLPKVIKNGVNYYYCTVSNQCDSESYTVTSEPARYEVNIPTYKVKFKCNGGTNISSYKVFAGEQVTKPAEPVRTGYTFAGWYLDKKFTTAYEFTDTVTGKITLYAKWK